MLPGLIKEGQVAINVQCWDILQENIQDYGMMLLFLVVDAQLMELVQMAQLEESEASDKVFRIETTDFASCVGFLFQGPYDQTKKAIIFNSFSTRLVHITKWILDGDGKMVGGNCSFKVPQQVVLRKVTAHISIGIQEQMVDLNNLQGFSLLVDPTMARPKTRVLAYSAKEIRANQVFCLRKASWMSPQKCTRKWMSHVNFKRHAQACKTWISKWDFFQIVTKFMNTTCVAATRKATKALTGHPCSRVPFLCLSSLTSYATFFGPYSTEGIVTSTIRGTIYYLSLVNQLTIRVKAIRVDNEDKSFGEFINSTREPGSTVKQQTLMVFYVSKTSMSRNTLRKFDLESIYDNVGSLYLCWTASSAPDIRFAVRTQPNLVLSTARDSPLFRKLYSDVIMLGSLNSSGNLLPLKQNMFFVSLLSTVVVQGFSTKMEQSNIEDYGHVYSSANEKILIQVKVVKAEVIGGHLIASIGSNSPCILTTAIDYTTYSSYHRLTMAAPKNIAMSITGLVVLGETQKGKFFNRLVIRPLQLEHPGARRSRYRLNASELDHELLEPVPIPNCFLLMIMITSPRVQQPHAAAALSTA
ncbi:hypothetical protein Tco_0764297 [Tanacetum coccineum]